MSVIPATQENCLNLEGRGSSEPRFCHCTPAWATRAKLHLKKIKNKNKNKSKKGIQVKMSVTADHKGDIVYRFKPGYVIKQNKQTTQNLPAPITLG